jgi:hypothetical protein
MPKVRVKDIDIYYEVHGEGPPFLLIMGADSTSKDWPQLTTEEQDRQLSQ